MILQPTVPPMPKKSESKLNCPNCGSPIDPEVHKCPYCDTSYFDLSSIDFTNNEPFYLKMKLCIGGKPAYITQLVRPRVGDIVITNNNVYASGINGNVIAFAGERSATTNVAFEAIPDNKRTLFNIYMEED